MRGAATMRRRSALRWRQTATTKTRSVHFGVSTVVRRDVPVQPGVLAFTELIARPDAHVQPIRGMVRETLIEQLGNPAFLGFTGAVAGRRMTTVSAWTSHE